MFGVRETLLRSDDWQQHLYPHDAEWGDGESGRDESDNLEDNKWFGICVGEKMNTAWCKAKNTAEKQLIPAKGLTVLDGLYWHCLSTTLIKMFVQLFFHSDELISAQNTSKTSKMDLLNQHG